MTATSDRYRRLAAAFSDKVAAVPEGAWADPTPCAEWDVRALVGHVAQTQGMFLGFVDRPTPDGPSVDDDPLGAWTAASDAVQAELDDPARSQVEFEGFAGRTTFEEAVDRFLCFDLVVHGWDLARATGQDETIAASEVERVREGTGFFGDMLRSPGVCGAEVELPDGGSDQDRLLAYLGRDPRVA